MYNQYWPNIGMPMYNQYWSDIGAFNIDRILERQCIANIGRISECQWIANIGQTDPHWGLQYLIFMRSIYIIRTILVLITSTWISNLWCLYQPYVLNPYYILGLFFLAVLLQFIFLPLLSSWREKYIIIILSISLTYNQYSKNYINIPLFFRVCKTLKLLEC